MRVHDSLKLNRHLSLRFAVECRGANAARAIEAMPGGFNLCTMGVGLV